jgi:hypothetical protein
MERLDRMTMTSVAMNERMTIRNEEIRYQAQQQLAENNAAAIRQAQELMMAGATNTFRYQPIPPPQPPRPLSFTVYKQLSYNVTYASSSSDSDEERQ